mgnify:CR=1 FL=1
MSAKKEKKVDVTERIKSFEDAVKATGRPDVPDFSNLPEDLRKYFIAQYKMLVITEALNEGWEPNWSNHNEGKWVPWFYHASLSSAGFVFYVAYCNVSNASAGDGSRLCFKSDELATYAGTQFIEIWNHILLKK